jgi:hypothetical protein
MVKVYGKKAYAYIVYAFCPLMGFFGISLHAKFYEVKDMRSLNTILEKSTISVVCFYKKKDLNSIDARQLRAIIKHTSQHNRYSYIKMAFIMVDFSSCVAIAGQYRPTIQLFVHGKPTNDTFMYIPRCPLELISFIDHELGDFIHTCFLDEEFYQGRLRFEAIRAWGFYAPY